MARMIQLSKLSQLADDLAYEIRTGEKHGSQSLVNAVNEVTRGKATRKMQALGDLTLYTLVLWPMWEPTSIVTNTLGEAVMKQLTVYAEETRKKFPQ